MMIQKKKMEIKRIFTIFFIFYFSISEAQNITNEFPFNKFKNTDKSIIIDDLTFSTLNFKNEISYNELKSFLRYEDGSLAIDVKDTESNKFYYYGKYEINKFKNIIIYQISKNKFSNYTYFYQLLFDSKNQLINMQQIGLRTNDKYRFDSNSLLFNDNFFIWKFKKIKDSLTLNFFKFNNDIDLKYENYACNENTFCSTYKAKFNTIPERNLNKFIFDNSFFENIKSIVPLKYCSPIVSTKILSSIGNIYFQLKENYFIEAKEIDKDEKIVFTLNLYYDNEKYHNIYEIVYHIINSKNEVIKSEQVSLSYTDLKNKIYLNWGKIIIDNNKIKIIKGCNGCEEEINIIKFKPVTQRSVLN